MSKKDTSPEVVDSKNGVAVFPQGTHPKLRQIASRNLTEAENAPVGGVGPVASESTADMKDRNAPKSKKELAAEGKVIQQKLDAAEQLDNGELDEEEEKAKKDAQEAHDKEVEEAKKKVNNPSASDTPSSEGGSTSGVVDTGTQGPVDKSKKNK